VLILEFIDICVFELRGYKMQTSWPSCYATVIAMAISLCLCSWGTSTCQPSTMKLTGPPSKELWCILAVYNMC